MTWLSLWTRMGKQPIKETRDMPVILKDGDKCIPLKLVYDKTGKYWWLEKEDKK